MDCTEAHFSLNSQPEMSDPSNPVFPLWNKLCSLWAGPDEILLPQNEMYIVRV